MNSDIFYSVVTTIQQPTAAMRRLARAVYDSAGCLLVAGDKKGPTEYPLAGSELLTLERQLQLPFRLPGLLPVNHYVRKNVAYLEAISRGAKCIYETDDDNAPLPTWKPRAQKVKSIIISKKGWCNVYSHFSRRSIWPRGFPLEEIGAARKLETGRVRDGIYSPIQQGLADGNPDVDAIWRLLQPEAIRFDRKPSLALGPGVWCPFNSQSTWWWPPVYPLLYLPSYCTFRMTDIWRSFIAQRCLWELGGRLSFHAAEVTQARNEHNLLKDFQDEVPGYLGNSKICRLLSELPLKPGQDALTGNMLQCYTSLAANGIFPRKEIRLLKAWLADVESARRTSKDSKP